jgi:hypothetical protein
LTRLAARGNVLGVTHRRNLGRQIMNNSKLYSILLISAFAAQLVGQATHVQATGVCGTLPNTATGNNQKSA